MPSRLQQTLDYYSMADRKHRAKMEDQKKLIALLPSDKNYDIRTWHTLDEALLHHNFTLEEASKISDKELRKMPKFGKRTVALMHDILANPDALRQHNLLTITNNKTLHSRRYRAIM